VRRVAEAPEGVDLGSLRGYFADNVEDADGAPLSAELIAGGRSNLTYAITDGEHEWVLRRPPLAHVVATAHDMGREYRVISALAATDVPVPRTFAFCEDPEVNGAPFYVMERVQGRVLRTVAEAATLPIEDARRCSEQVVDVLARLHGVDFETVGLGGFGKPDGFVERNLRRWGKQWEANKTRELAGVDEVARRLSAALPASGAPAIVHGDYRLDNTMVAADDPGRIVAVLDWEMSTLGDPLTDLGLLLVYWGGEAQPTILTAQGVGAVPGFISRDDVVERYARASGRSIDHLDFYVVFAMYKLAIIVEGINARYLMGKTLGEGFDQMGAMTTGLIDLALEVADSSADAKLHG
jgi:aminoglycoside phosphotransferase (APT) family kinase protein